MAKAILKVTVNGGIAPLDIQVRFYKDGTYIPPNVSSPKSFTHVFDNLQAGSDYDITIGGFNPSGGNTVCELTLDEGITLNPPDDSPITKTGQSYAVGFHFSV